jgi:hypothetical protein
MDKEVTPLSNNRTLVLMATNTNDPMQRGTCPVCKGQTGGHTGGGGMIVERAYGGQAVPGSSLSTNWGHFACIEPWYWELVRVLQRTPLAAASDVVWQTGTQTEMIRYLRLHQPRSIVVNMDETPDVRRKTSRYHWRLALPTEEERT